MPYKVPNIPSFTLKGVDDKIQDLQVILTSLTWLDYSFGLCEHAHRIEDGSVINYPAQWVNNRSDYIDLRPFPDDFYSYSFWDVEDPAGVEYNNDEVNAAKRKFALYRYNVAAIFVLDLKQLDFDTSYNETKSKLREDIVNKFETGLLGFNAHFWVTAIYEHDITQIFKGFTIDKPEEFKYPYQAFRIEGELLFKRACPVSNTYG